VLDGGVVRQEQAHLVAGERRQRLRQRLHHVSQAAGLDERRGLGGDHGNIHTIAPLLMTRGVIRRAQQLGARLDDDVFVEDDAAQLRACADPAALHDDAVAHLGVLVDLDLAEDDGVVRPAEDVAAVRDETVGRLALHAEKRRHGVADLRVDGDLAAEEAVAHVLVQKHHAVVVVFEDALVEQRDVVERIDVDLQLALVVLRQQVVPLEVVFAVRQPSRG